MKRVVLLSAVLAFCLYADEVKSLNDMTVTAQKTEESVQDVPIAMSVFDDINLEDKDITDIKDVSYFVPNFYLNNGTFGMNMPTIRGITADGSTMSSAVGLYVDGIPLTNNVGFDAILEDIQRVEVLRGPQGTLYGKNAEAGVINVVTKKPNNELGGKLSLSYGEDNKQEIGLNLRTPIIKDKLFLGISGKYYAKDGFMEDNKTGEIVDDEKNYFGRIYLRATPTDRLELALIASKHKTDNGQGKQNVTTNENIRIFYGDLVGNQKLTDDSYAFKVRYNFDYFDLESITSYKKYVQNGDLDNDATSAKIFHTFTNFHYKTISEELKLDGEVGNLKWLVGGFGSKFEKTGGFTMDSINPAMVGENKSDVTEKNLGIFTHLNYAFSDKLNLIGGIRYDKDKVDMKNHITNESGDKSYSNISPKIALQYKFNPNFMTYVTVSKGYKAGGLYTFATPGLPNSYENESLWNYELGFKSTMLNGKLNFNADIFYIDMKDKQVFTMANQYYGSYISNAASASSYGLEIDTNYAINDNFSAFATFGYNEAKFDEFSDFLGDYKDNYMPYAPKYSYSLGGTFRGFGGVYASANLRGYGKMYFDNANTTEHKAYTLVDAKIGYEWEKFDIYLYANNLFDKEYDLKGVGGNIVMLSEPREIGVRLSYRF